MSAHVGPVPRTPSSPSWSNHVRETRSLRSAARSVPSPSPPRPSSSAISASPKPKVTQDPWAVKAATTYAFVDYLTGLQGKYDQYSTQYQAIQNRIDYLNQRAKLFEGASTQARGGASPLPRRVSSSSPSRRIAASNSPKTPSRSSNLFSRSSNKGKTGSTPAKDKAPPSPTTKNTKAENLANMPSKKVAGKKAVGNGKAIKLEKDVREIESRIRKEIRGNYENLPLYDEALGEHNLLLLLFEDLAQELGIGDLSSQDQRAKLGFPSADELVQQKEKSKLFGSSSAKSNGDAPFVLTPKARNQFQKIAIDRPRSKLLESAGWEETRSEIVLTGKDEGGNAKEVALTSTVSPFCQLEGGEAIGLKNGEGISCHASSSFDIPNAWLGHETVKTKKEGETEKPRTISFMRHGTLSPYGIGFKEFLELPEKEFDAFFEKVGKEFIGERADFQEKNVFQKKLQHFGVITGSGIITPADDLKQDVKIALLLKKLQKGEEIGKEGWEYLKDKSIIGADVTDLASFKRKLKSNRAFKEDISQRMKKGEKILQAIRKTIAFRRAKQVFMESARETIRQRMATGEWTNENVKAKIGKGGSLGIPASFVNLQTGFRPGNAMRPIVNKVAHGFMEELPMVEDQREALAELNDAGAFEMDCGDLGKINIKPNVLDFNFPVNEGAFAAYGGKKSYEEAMISNKPSMDKLIGNKANRDLNRSVGSYARSSRVDNRIAELELFRLSYDADSPAVIAIDKQISGIKELARQIADLWDSEEYREAGFDPYKLASRVVLLSALMDETPNFNCKSGKDRTGILNTRVADLLQAWFMTGSIPDWRADRDEDQQRRSREIVAQHPSTYVQLLNVGGEGYKVDGQEVPWAANLGTALRTYYGYRTKEEYINDVHGISKSVAS